MATLTKHEFTKPVSLTGLFIVVVMDYSCESGNALIAAEGFATLEKADAYSAYMLEQNASYYCSTKHKPIPKPISHKYLLARDMAEYARLHITTDTGKRIVLGCVPRTPEQYEEYIKENPLPPKYG